MFANDRITAAILGAVLAAGCASHPDFPPGIDGYICGRYENTPAGKVSVEVHPDYRGGYRSFMMRWESAAAGVDSLEARAYWSQGRDAIAPPGWLSISRIVVERIPPRGARFRLQLSSGESREEELSLPKEYGKIAGPYRFGTSLQVRDMDFIEKFARAAWVDITLVDPAGVVHAQGRLDLAGVPEAITQMRRLGDQAMADLADYRNRCHATEHVDITEII